MTNTNTSTKPVAKSALAKLIAAKAPAYFDYPVRDILGLDSDTKLKIRVSPKGEQDAALVEAHRYIKRPAVASDDEIVLDAKNSFILAVACRDESDPDSVPAFPSGEWLMAHLTTYQIASLLNAYRDATKRTGHALDDVSDEALEALVELCGQLDADRAYAALASATHSFMGDAVIGLARKLYALRASLPSEPTGDDEAGDMFESEAEPEPDEASA